VEVDIHSRTSSPTRGCHSHRRAQAPAVLATDDIEREGSSNVENMVVAGSIAAFAWRHECRLDRATTARVAFAKIALW